MEFEWDEAKRQKVWQKHKVDLYFAARIFRGFYISRSDGRGEYGESRSISVGMVGDDCFVVVHTEREGKIRLITAWKGGRNERAAYEDHLARRNRGDA